MTKQAAKIRDRAAACYASQMGGGPRRSSILGFASKFMGQRDCYMRCLPPVDRSRCEADLFEGVK
jgi:hypothetical protein